MEKELTPKFLVFWGITGLIASIILFVCLFHLSQGEGDKYWPAFLILISIGVISASSLYFGLEGTKSTKQK